MLIISYKTVYLHRERILNVSRTCSDSDTDCKDRNKKLYDQILFNKNIVMAIRRRIIILPKGKAEQICNALKIGRTTLYSALNFSSNSDDAKLTRQKALSEYGGILTTKVIP